MRAVLTASFPTQAPSQSGSAETPGKGLALFTRMVGRRVLTPGGVCTGKRVRESAEAWGVCSPHPSSGPAREKFAVAMSEKGFLQDVCGTSETQVDNVDISWHKCGAPTRGPWYSVTRRSHREAASASYSVRKSFFLLSRQRRK